MAAVPVFGVVGQPDAGRALSGVASASLYAGGIEYVEPQAEPEAVEAEEKPKPKGS